MFAEWHSSLPWPWTLRARKSANDDTFPLPSEFPALCFWHLSCHGSCKLTQRGLEACWTTLHCKTTEIGGNKNIRCFVPAWVEKNDRKAISKRWPKTHPMGPILSKPDCFSVSLHSNRLLLTGWQVRDKDLPFDNNSSVVQQSKTFADHRHTHAHTSRDVLVCK